MADKIGARSAKPKSKGAAAPKAAPKTSDKATAGLGGDGRALAPTDNERAAYEAEQAQLVSFVAQIMAQQRTVKAAKAVFDEALAEIKIPLDAAKARELELFRLAKAAKFDRQWIEAYIADMSKDTRERIEDAKREQRHKRMLGIQTDAEQLDLFSEKTPAEARDEAYWKSEGYLAYQRGEACKAPDQCPQRFIQAFAQGWHDGEAATIWAMGKAAEQPAPAPGPDAPDDADEAEKTPAELKAEERAALDGLNALGDGGDGFEASADELADQTDRRVVQEQREADPVPEAV